MLAINDILQGRYRIIRQLGRGGMGAVYEAKDERLGSSVALKEVLLDSDKSRDTHQRELTRRAFEREARILANLYHEAFPRVTDYFTENDGQFLVMELVYGDDLGELLEKRAAPFPFEDVLRWTEQLLDALDYLHSQDPPIIHRDIKPQNLKLTSRGKIKLLDFGIAKGADAVSSNTMANHTVAAATQNFSPIEQTFRVLHPSVCGVIIEKHSAKADRMLSLTTDARSDIYALGATLYQISTAQLPVDSLKRALAVWSNEPDPLPSPHELNPGIPEYFSVALLKAMAVDHENRFGSAAEMQNALEQESAHLNQTIKVETPTTEKTLQFSSDTRTEAMTFNHPETPPEPSIATVFVPRKRTPSSNSKSVMTLGAIVLLSILLISAGIVGAYFAVNSIFVEPPPTPSRTPEMASPTPSVAPSIKPTVGSIIPPTPTQPPVETGSPKKADPQEEQPTVQPKTPVPQPTVKKTPALRKTPPPKKKNMDCIFNDDCD